ncbi:hypothetical protein LTR78_000635 [Recurvomyces mirabilis]|uniref:Uncharacterized protein n=1 Tax=Recurvomyces mirabilis TaxID=574656 RepID=A0AAE0WY26_9PEZI|nr:hypothetical protein LTR78_000635 [Recurvomyces mirabilis]KAK5162289.1 hypothetical protein LTS14_000636 [Recurvomyces mirabilis]
MTSSTSAGLTAKPSSDKPSSNNTKDQSESSSAGDNTENKLTMIDGPNVDLTDSSAVFNTAARGPANNLQIADAPIAAPTTGVIVFSSGATKYIIKFPDHVKTAPVVTPAVKETQAIKAEVFTAACGLVALVLSNFALESCEPRSQDYGTESTILILFRRLLSICGVTGLLVLCMSLARMEMMFIDAIVASAFGKAA